MVNMEKLQFWALQMDGSNYLALSLDLKANILAKDLSPAIRDVASAATMTSA